MKKPAVIILVIACVAAFAYLGPLNPKLSPAKNSAAAPVPGGQAPAFRVPGAKGGEIDLSAYAGKPVMFMFFTEGCPYCRIAGPALEKLSKNYGPKGLTVIGVSIEEEKEAALNFARDLAITFPLAYDGRDAYRAYKARGVPYIYLVDGDRKLIDVWEGYDESYAPMMKSAIEALLPAK